MDYFTWSPHFGMFWIFPLLCVLFMVVMMFGHGGMSPRFRHGARSSERPETGREILERRYASGEIGKEQYDTMRRDLDS